MPFDGGSTPVLDTPRRVSATIGRAGGTLASGGLTLTIPAGALSEDTTIALTPLTDLADSPLAGTIIGGAKLEPEGLRFLRPAILSFALPAGTPATEVIGFGSAGDGSELHLQPHSVSGGTISLQLWHFSTAGGSSGGSSAAAAMQSRPISNAERQAKQRIAAAHRACNAEVAQGISDGPACANVIPESVRALFDWYTNAIRPGWRRPRTRSPSRRRPRSPNGSPGRPRCGSSSGTTQQARPPAAPCKTSATPPRRSPPPRSAAHAQRRLDNCTGTSLASQIRDVARMADFAGAGALDLTSLDPPLPDATNGDLLHECAHLRIDVLDFPVVPARLRANTLRGQVVTDVHAGPDRTDVPFTLEVAGSLVTTIAGDGTFQTTISPTSAPLNVTLEAEATNPSLENTAFTAVEQLVRQQVRDRLELQALSTTSVPAGGSITVRVRVAGDGMAGMTVVFGGPGTTSPSPLITNAQGEATAVFTVLSNATQTNDFVTAVLPDGTSAGVAITIGVVVTVSLSPTVASVIAGGTLNFTATVTNSFLGVTWSATGGTIVSTGSGSAITARYEAGTTPGNYTVTATSVADPSVFASATVTISGGDATGNYVGEMCHGGNGLCAAGRRIGYSCGVRSFAGPGTVCALNTGADGSLNGDVLLPFCVIETNGTITGGTFTGRITFCSGSQVNDRMRAARIEGSITGGTAYLHRLRPVLRGSELPARALRRDKDLDGSDTRERGQFPHSYPLTPGG